jgi:hypothetical protein
MNTLNRILAEQTVARHEAHEKAMAKSPWIRESVQAYRTSTPEQLAQVEAILRKRGQIKWLHYYVACAIQKCQAITLLVMMSSPALVVGKIRAYDSKILKWH